MNPPWLALVVLLSGCWFSFDGEGRACTNDDECIAGYHCVAQVCIEGDSRDAAVADTSIADTSIADAAELDATDAGLDAGPQCVAQGPRLAVGLEVACGIDQGSVVCWGTDLVGGGPPTAPQTVDFPPDSPTRWSAVFASVGHACALSCDGQLYCWGVNDWRQLGRFTMEDRVPPGPVQAPDTRYRSVALRSEGGCGVRTTAGIVDCWGRTTYELVPSSTSPRSLPLQTPFESMDTVACGTSACCALSTARNLCWGRAEGGVIPSSDWWNLEAPRPVETSALVVDLPPDVQLIAPAGLATCTVTEASEVYCSGNSFIPDGDYTGLLGLPAPERGATAPRRVYAAPSDWTISSIASGGDAACVLERNVMNPSTSRVLCWGWLDNEAIFPPERRELAEISDWVALAGGGYAIFNRRGTVCGLRADQSVYCVGSRIGPNDAQDGQFTRVLDVTLRP